jgi:zinc and cadmium transporter
MESKIIWIIAAVALDGVAGLSGGIIPPSFVHRNIASLLAFAAGTLVGVAFFDLLPNALHTGAPAQVMLACLAGFGAFYMVESFLGSHATGQGGHKHSTIGPMILVGDALHNATDGVALAAAFLADTRTGIVTTLAVIVHELPQEIGDYSILVAHGYSRRKALFFLCLVQFSALIGAGGALWAAEAMANATPFLLGASAGGFIYIAAADLLPELQRHKSPKGPLFKLLSFCSGLAIIAVLEHFMK